MNEKFNELETLSIPYNHLLDNCLYYKCLVSSAKSLKSTGHLISQIIHYIHDLKMFKVTFSKKYFMRYYFKFRII